MIKRPEKSKFLVTLLLDRSASMGGIKGATIDGVNTWLAELRRSDKDMRFSLIQFDSVRGEANNPNGHGLAPANAVPASGVLMAGGMGLSLANPFNFPQRSQEVMCLEKTCEAVPVKDVPDLTDATYLPRGNTPLIDAAVTTIRAIEASMEGREDIGVILAIQTDGLENSSTLNEWDQLRALIKDKETMGWEILFMGAGEAAMAHTQGRKMGVSSERTISYGLSETETKAAFRATARNTVDFAAGAVLSTAYTMADRSEAGEKADAR